MSASEASEHDDDEINAAHSVQGNRLSAASASQYRRHLELFKAWVQSSWHSTGDPAEQMRQLAPVLNNSGEFVLPMSVEVVESFLGHLSNRRIPVRPPRGAVVDATVHNVASANEAVVCFLHHRSGVCDNVASHSKRHPSPLSFECLDGQF